MHLTICVCVLNTKDYVHLKLVKSKSHRILLENGQVLARIYNIEFQ